ncbi:MAG: hypothetical protein R3A51_22695, partial [Nannocystaceae bacterium]
MRTIAPRLASPLLLIFALGPAACGDPDTTTTGTDTDASTTEGTDSDATDTTGSSTDSTTAGPTTSDSDATSEPTDATDPTDTTATESTSDTDTTDSDTDTTDTDTEGLEDYDVVVCDGDPLVPPAEGTCEVTQPGAGGLLLRGAVLTPGTIYSGGAVKVNSAGIIECVGCDCEAGNAAVVDCADGVISPGLINTHDHITFANNKP